MRKLTVPFILIICLTFPNKILTQEIIKTDKKTSFSKDGKLFINKDLGVYLWLSTSPEDNSQKVRLQSDSTKRYTNPMYFDTEGYNTLRTPSAVDTITRKTVYPLRDIIFELYSDGLPPITSIKFISNSKTINNKTYFGNQFGFSISSRDGVSGVEKSFYSIDEKPYTEYTDTVKITKEGESTIKYYSFDKVGNIEDVNTKTIYIDKTPPTTDYEILGVQNDNYVSPDATIKLTSTDNLIGVKEIYYKINNGPVMLYKIPISVKNLGTQDGILTYFAEDLLGNKESENIIGGTKFSSINESAEGNLQFEFYVDNKAPEVEINFDGHTSKGKYNYVSSKTKIVVNASDDKSGVNEINYSVNNTSVDQKYNDGILFEDEGIAYIRINATDYVGNQSSTLTNAYFVDNTAPTTKIIVNSPKHQVSDTLFISNATKISLTASDNASGISKIYYAVNNESFKPYESAFTIDKDGFAQIKYYTVDNVGNEESQNQIEVYVDNIAPEIFNHFSITPIGAKTVREEEYTIYPSSVQLYVAATDESSGGETITYKINNGTVKTLNPITGFTPGNYEIEITAIDALGNSKSNTVKFAIEK